MLEINKLSFSYNNKEILKKIDLFIESKEFVGIIGPNGSGKTTLLKNISKVILPDTGVIYLQKNPLNNYKANKLARLMAVVPQETNISYNFSVYELIMMGRNPYQDRWGRIQNIDKELVVKAMKLTDTVKFRDKKISELSGGERQRVIIARALAQNPKILLLDEPTASLDINYQIEIFDLLTYLNKKLKLTIIVVSHDLNLSSQYCSKLVLLKNGQIYKIGNAKEVLTVENMRNVYQADVLIKNNPLTRRPFVILKPKNKIEQLCQKKEKIHVVCGGGSGKALLQRLFMEGYNLSCGVLNQGDSDWEVAKKLDIDIVEIPAFGPISDKSLKTNQMMIEKSDLIILTDMPFGYGNIANLKLIAKIINKKIILYNYREIKSRDYTGGQAEKYWNIIVNSKNITLLNKGNNILEIINTFLEKPLL